MITFDREWLIGAIRAIPRSGRDPNNNGSDASHVTALITFVTQQYLLISFTRPAFLADDPTVIVVAVVLHHRRRRRLHDLRHGPVLLRIRRRASERRFRAAEGREARPGEGRAGGSHRGRMGIIGVLWGYNWDRDMFSEGVFNFDFLFDLFFGD